MTESFKIDDVPSTEEIPIAAVEIVRNRNGSFITSLVFAVIFVLVWLIYDLTKPDAVYTPSVSNVAIWVVLVIFINQVRNAYARYTFLIWAFWFVLGSISIYAKNQIDGGLNYKIDPSIANLYYLSCIFCAVLLALTFQTIFPSLLKPRPELLQSGSDPIVWLILTVFPALYALSIVFSTGGIPLLSGRDVSAEMYQIDYGPLHDFGIVVSIVCVMIWEKFNSRNSFASKTPVKFVVLLILIFYLAAAAFDGRRALTMFAIAAMMLFYIASPGTVLRWVWLGLLGFFGLTSYVSSATLRAGGQVSDAFANFYEPLATVGTEYRDFVYGFTRLNQTAVQHSGYDWLGSTLATMTPSFLARAIGIDKNALVLSDSARSLMGYYNVELGVRIGLPGELWFAYGWWGVLVFALFGPITLFTAWFAVRTEHFVRRALLLTLQALWSLSILGQSSVTFGVILTMLYLAIFVALIEFVTKHTFMGRRFV